MTRGGSHFIGWLLTWVVLGIALASCAPTFQNDITMGQRLGFRPDEPDMKNPMESTGCADFAIYAQYAKRLEESYRTRTTQNRTWIYVAGITGLAVAAASGALAAATAVAAGTLALLSISGGFTAAAFATINNSELANVYNAAASDIGTARTAAEGRVSLDRTDENCAAQLATLMSAVSGARNTLELARTDSAEGALVRAAAGQKALMDVIGTQLDANPTRVTLPAEITQIDGQTAGVDVPAGGKVVTLTVVNAQLDKVAPTEIKVAIGPMEVGIDSVSTTTTQFTYEVKVRVPGKVASTAGEYAPSLIVGRSKQRILSRSQLVLRYAAPPAAPAPATPPVQPAPPAPPPS